jgi:hypothetical protein
MTKSELRTQWIRINPKLAREWLKRNTQNRPHQPRHVEALRVAFANGEYRETHQGIAFDEDYQLLDGQHRLMAIAQQPDEFSVMMLVTFGLKRKDAWTAIDVQVRQRSVADVLDVRADLAAVAQVFARIVTNRPAGGSPETLRPIVEMVNPFHAALVAECNTAVRCWSSAPMKAGAVWVAMQHPECADYVYKLYAAMIHGDFAAMPAHASNAYRAWANGGWSVKDQMETFARAVKLFDPSSKDITRIQIKHKALILGNVREQMLALLPHLAAQTKLPPAYKAARAKLREEMAQALAKNDAQRAEKIQNEILALMRSQTSQELQDQQRGKVVYKSS